MLVKGEPGAPLTCHTSFLGPLWMAGAEDCVDQCAWRCSVSDATEICAWPVAFATEARRSILLAKMLVFCYYQ